MLLFVVFRIKPKDSFMLGRNPTIEVATPLSLLFTFILRWRKRGGCLNKLPMLALNWWFSCLSLSSIWDSMPLLTRPGTLSDF